MSARFKVDPAFDAGWDHHRAPEALEAALADPEVDLVLAVGSLVTHAAIHAPESLSKPVLSAYVHRTEFLDLPYSEAGESRRPNLGFVIIPQRVEADVEAFRRIAPFDVLHVAVAAEELPLIEAELGVTRYEEVLGVELRMVPIHADAIDSALVQMREAQAVYLTELQRLSVDERQALIDGLIEAELPTFAMMGHADVDRGVLAGMTPEIEAQLLRRVAINLARVIRGQEASGLPVLLTVDSRLRINARTAVQIDYVPSREILALAEVLHAEVLGADLETLTFIDLLRMAEQGNASLKVVDAELEGTRQDQFRARSGLLPQINATLSGQYVDTSGFDSEDVVLGTVSLVQQVFDDEIRSGYRAAQEVFQSAEQSREATRLDVLADAGTAYYNLALALADYRVVEDDVRLTRDNLELAKLRVDVGFSGRDEVIRFESVLAGRQTDLFIAAEMVEAARIALNQVLGTDQDRRWIPEAPAVDPDVFPALSGRLDPVFNSLDRQSDVRRELVAIALENAPELVAFDEAIAAQRIEVGFRNRRFVLPSVFAEASYTELIDDPEGFFSPQDDTFSVSLNINFPLFEGGGRRADLAAAEADLDALERQRDQVAELIEQRMRTAMHGVESSFSRIEFARRSAELAAENLELVREQYAQGTVNVTDLLDAQNQQLTANQFDNASIYEFLSDFVELQRAMAWFEVERTAAERDAFVARILSIAGGR
ncbi:MAG: TolC family protein [Acidobacteriota bacterium]